MLSRKFAYSLPSLLTFLAFNALAQQPPCSVATGGNIVATEGLSELLSPITFTCSGGPPAGSTVSTDIIINLNTSVTNRIGPTGQPMNVAVTVDTGSGPVVAAAVPQLSGTNTLIVDQVKYVVPNPSSTVVTVQISGIRAAVSNITGGTMSGLVSAQILNTGFNLANSSNTLTPGVTTGPSMLASIQNNGFPCAGSALPAGSFGYSDLIAAGTAFSTVRVTEGPTNAFAPRGPGADTGNRILVNLSGYPAGVIVFVPTTIAGNDASTPTSGGALEESASGGVYTPGSGQLLLQLVTGADVNGAGGTVSAAPGSIQDLNSVTQVNLTAGAGYVVYEVMDSSPLVVESAQIPVYISSPASACASSASLMMAAVYGPVSTVSTATPTDPIPRFVSEAPGPDCQIFKDCDSISIPKIMVDQTSLTLNGNSLGNPVTTTLNVSNGGQGELQFSLSISYPTDSGWLIVSPTSGIDSAAVAVTADPTNLAQGSYTATIVIDAGAAGMIDIPVTFVVGPVGVTIKGIVSAASFQVGGSIAPNSYAAIFGVNLAGSNVSVTVGDATCTTCISYAGSTQVNFLVPQRAANSLLTGHIPVYLTASGVASNTYLVPLALNAPAIFNPGIVNQDGSVNQAGQPTTQSQYISIYMTGLAIPLTGVVTVTMGTQTGIGTLYAGPSSAPGEQQINVTVPAGLSPVSGSVPVSVCVQAGTQPALCSPSINLYVQ